MIADIVKGAAINRRDGSQFILTTHSPLLCEMLPEYLIACTWSPSTGTTFRRLELRRDGLFTATAIAEALDESTESAPQ